MMPCFVWASALPRCKLKSFVANACNYGRVALQAKFLAWPLSNSAFCMGYSLVIVQTVYQGKTARIFREATICNVLIFFCFLGQLWMWLCTLWVILPSYNLWALLQCERTLCCRCAGHFALWLCECFDGGLYLVSFYCLPCLFLAGQFLCFARNSVWSLHVVARRLFAFGNLHGSWLRPICIFPSLGCILKQL